NEQREQVDRRGREPMGIQRQKKRALVVAAGILAAALTLSWIGGPGGATAAVGPTDLSLTKSDSADPVTIGTNFSYTILVKNEGMNDAGAANVTDTLPSPGSYLSATPTSGTCTKSGAKITCALG